MTGKLRVKAGEKATSKPNPFASIFHPNWSSLDDHRLMVARSSGDNFTDIATRLGRQRIAVEQRWHRLRVIPNIVKRLEAFGLSNEPYSCDGVEGKRHA